MSIVPTGTKDKRGRDILIDVMTYDRDYWDAGVKTLLTIATGQPHRALTEATADVVRRVRGMQALTVDLAKDFAAIVDKLLVGQA